MLTIERTVSASVDAAPERCLERLGDVAAYPSWASLIRSAEVVDGRVRLAAELLGVTFVMDCELEVTTDRAVLRRVPYTGDDEERFEAAWVVAPEGAGSRAELTVRAALDAPGPARFLRGRIERRLADDLLADFSRSL